MTAGFIQKHHWAGLHLAQLKKELSKWFTTEKYPLLDEADPEGPYERRCVITHVPPIPTNPFSLIVGDVLYALRSCLDNLVHELSRANGSVTSDQWAFPVCFDKLSKAGSRIRGKDTFQSLAKKRIGAMDPRAQAIIERLQPYHRGTDHKSCPLFALDHLCNIDKHRTIHLITLGFDGVNFVTHPNLADVNPVLVHAGRLEAGTTLVRYTPIPRDPKLGVNVAFSPTFKIGFADGTYRDQCVITLLQAIIEHVSHEVIVPLTQFLPWGHVLATC